MARGRAGVADLARGGEAEGVRVLAAAVAIEVDAEQRVVPTQRLPQRRLAGDAWRGEVTARRRRGEGDSGSALAVSLALSPHALRSMCSSVLFLASALPSRSTGSTGSTATPPPGAPPPSPPPRAASAPSAPSALLARARGEAAGARFLLLEVRRALPPPMTVEASESACTLRQEATMSAGLSVRSFQLTSSSVSDGAAPALDGGRGGRL